MLFARVINVLSRSKRIQSNELVRIHPLALRIKLGYLPIAAHSKVLPPL